MRCTWVSVVICVMLRGVLQCCCFVFVRECASLLYSVQSPARSHVCPCTSLHVTPLSSGSCLCVPSSMVTNWCCLSMLQQTSSAAKGEVNDEWSELATGDHRRCKSVGGYKKTLVTSRSGSSSVQDNGSYGSTADRKTACKVRVSWRVMPFNVKRANPKGSTLDCMPCTLCKCFDCINNVHIP